MVNEFVLDDLSSSWTDSIYENKSNSKYMQEVAPTWYTYIFVYIYIYNKVALQSPLTVLPSLRINLSKLREGECMKKRRNIWLLVKCCASTFIIQCPPEFVLGETTSHPKLRLDSELEAQTLTESKFALQGISSIALWSAST